MMPIQRLNHAVLYVRDVEVSGAFYQDVLGFRTVMEIPGRALFLQAAGGQAGDSPAGQTTVGLYHLAWEVDTLAELGRVAGLLTEHGALVGSSDHGTTKALYGKDPNGIEFEVCWLVPADRITDDMHGGARRELDIEAEIERFGADTRGGVGVSTPALA
jgi:catechol-2,3-dioxygenase